MADVITPTNTPIEVPAAGLSVDDPKFLESLFEAPKGGEGKARAADGTFLPKSEPLAAKLLPGTAGGAADAGEAAEPSSEDPDGLSPDDLDDAELDGEGSTSVELSDDLEIDVRIDDKVSKVTLKDLKANYSGEKAILTRIQAASEAKKAADVHAEALYQANQQALSKLTHLDKIITGFSQPQINWEELKAKDPLQFALKREEAREWQDKQFQVKQEIERVNLEQSKLQTQALDNYLTDQANALVSKLPDMTDPNKAPVLMGKFKSAAKEYGFTDQEFDSVLDHRQLLVLADAAKYRELVARKAAIAKGVTPVAPSKTVKTVAANKPVASTQKKQEAAIINRARQTGNVDDIAATLIVSGKQAQARR